MRISYHLVVLLGAISATVAAVILPVPTPTDATNDETLNITGALGINCRGSSKCHGSAAAQYLVQLINELPDGVFYLNQQQIGELVFREILFKRCTLYLIEFCRYLQHAWAPFVHSFKVPMANGVRISSRLHITSQRTDVCLVVR